MYLLLLSSLYKCAMQVLGVVGEVHAVNEDGDVIVQYHTGVRWTFNPIALKKVDGLRLLDHSLHRDSVGSIPLTGPFDGLNVGDFVRIASDEQFVRKQQFGHGEWVDSMAQVSSGYVDSNAGHSVVCEMFVCKLLECKYCCGLLQLKKVKCTKCLL